jgi:hypothetical protein
MSDYYSASPPELPDLYEEICIKRNCRYLNENGECVIDRCPEDCAEGLEEDAEAWRDLCADRKIDERKLHEWK